MVTSHLSLFCFFNHHLPNQDYAAQLYSMSVAQETPPICHRSYFLAGIDRFIHSPVDGHLDSHDVFFNTLDSSSLPHYIRESETQPYENTVSFSSGFGSQPIPELMSLRVPKSRAEALAFRIGHCKLPAITLWWEHPYLDLWPGKAVGEFSRISDSSSHPHVWDSIP